MRWCEVATAEVLGKLICVKDAMIMLDDGDLVPEYPHVVCEPGEFVFEIFVEPGTFHAYRARMRRVGSKPELGKVIGAVDVDNAFIAFHDYETFQKEVDESYEDYGEWTADELFDELGENFSGQIAFAESPLLYVQSGDGDGTYDCFELIENGKIVGIECSFES